MAGERRTLEIPFDRSRIVTDSQHFAPSPLRSSAIDSRHPNGPRRRGAVREDGNRVAQPGIPKSESKRDWRLSQTAFRNLLEWLDEGADSDGGRYLEIRTRLARYFDRKNCTIPDELADETLNRVARRLEEEGSIETDTPAHYCYIVARFVFMEYLRKPGVESLAELEAQSGRPRTHPAELPGLAGDPIEKEKRAECLDHCLRALTADQRNMIITYYTGDQRLKLETRRSLAAKLSITLNALSIRACRIRDKLEACVTKCLNKS